MIYYDKVTQVFIIQTCIRKSIRTQKQKTYIILKPMHYLFLSEF